MVDSKIAPIIYQTALEKKKGFGMDPGGREQRALLGQSTWTWATAYVLLGAGGPC